MTEYKALEVLQISDMELQEITMLKLSRKLAKRKMEVDEEDPIYEDLFDAFEYIKANYVAMKSAKKSSVPEGLFPTLNPRARQTKSAGPILHLLVDNIPTDVSMAGLPDGTSVPIFMPKKVNTRDTLVFVYDKQTYDGEVFVKNISQKEYREFNAR